MKTRNAALSTGHVKDQKVRRTPGRSVASSDLFRISDVRQILADEGNENLRHYIDWLGLSHDPKILVLSSVHHYYYDAEEMKSVRTIVNLRELNHIREIDNFLNSMFLILPPMCHFIGCFTDSRKQGGLLSDLPMLNAVISYLRSGSGSYLTGKRVTRLLGANGFRLIDMTELGGMTYFLARNERVSDN